MATKRNPGKYDCYDKAEEDEPIFVLLARDKHAPTLVWLWTAMRSLDGEDEEKVNEGKLCMIDMLTWQLENGRHPIGIGAAALAAVLELVRAANYSVSLLGGAGSPTTEDQFRVFLSALSPQKEENNGINDSSATGNAKAEG